MGKRTLTADQEADIFAIVLRTEAAGDKVNYQVIASEFGVDRSTISRAVERQRKAANSATRDDSPPHSASQDKGNGMDGRERSVADATEVDMKASAGAAASHNRLHPSPLNPRKSFDPAKMSELVESVHAKGVLLPILVRYANQPGNNPIADAVDGDFEIIAGERRWRAARVNIEAGLRPEDWPMPIKLVHPCSDREMLEIALTENMARNDMTPLEEAEAFSALTAMGASAADIAKPLGMNKRTVLKRLRLVRDLAPAVLDALRAAEISVEAANILASYAPKGDQVAWMNKIRDGEYDTTAQIKNAIVAMVIPLGRNIFDASLYKGDWIEDDEKDGVRYFADVAQFMRLQRIAAMDKVKDFLATSAAWAELFDKTKNQQFRPWEYSHRPNHPKAGVAVILEPNGIVQITEDMVADSVLAAEQKTPSAGGNGAAEPEPITKAHGGRARNRKTAILQEAVAQSPMVAVRLAILGLIGGTWHAVKMRAENTASDDRVIADWPRQVIAPFLLRIAGAAEDGFGFGDTGITKSGWKEVDEVAIWRELADMADHDVMALFAAIMALRTGSWNNGQPDIGDKPVVVEIARTLGLVGREDELGLVMTPEDLDGLRKPALLSVAAMANVLHHNINAYTAKDLKAVLTKGGFQTDHLVLPSLRFATKDEVLQAYAKAVEPAQIDLEQAIERVKAAAPAAVPLAITFEDVRRALAAHSIFAGMAPPDTAFLDLVGDEDFPAAAETLATTFDVPALKPAHLRGVEDLADLVTLLNTLHSSAVKAA